MTEVQIQYVLTIDQIQKETDARLMDIVKC